MATFYSINTTPFLVLVVGNCGLKKVVDFQGLYYHALETTGNMFHYQNHPRHCERDVWVRDKADMIGGGAGICQIARFTVTGENEAWS